MSTNHIPTQFAATNSDGETIDLRALDHAALRDYRAEAANHGDIECVKNCQAILRDRGWA